MGGLVVDGVLEGRTGLGAGLVKAVRLLMLSLLGLVSGSFCVEALVVRASRVVVVLGLSRGIWVEALVPREAFAPTRKSNAAGRPGMMYVFFFALTVVCGMSAGSDLAGPSDGPIRLELGARKSRMEIISSPMIWDASAESATSVEIW